jgi:hypothetical protein
LSLPCPESWSHFGWTDEKYFLPLAQKLADLPEDQRPEAVVCHGLSQAEILMRVFAERGLPLLAAGASAMPHHGRAWNIPANHAQLGVAAASLLLWKIQQPQRPSLRVGVPMSLEAREMEPLSLQRKEAANA